MIINDFRNMVLGLKKKGVTYKGIAESIGISRGTLDYLLKKAKKLDVEVWEKFKEIYG